MTNPLFKNAILKHYVRKQAFFAILGAIVGLLLLKLLFDYLAEIEDVSDTYSYFDAFKYIALTAPEALQQYMPIGALVGAVIGLGLLANNSELTVMQASGLSRFRIVAWVLEPALLFVIAGILLSQFVIPQTNSLAHQIKNKQPIVSSSLNGYWEKTASQIVNIGYADTKGVLQNIKIWQLDNADNNSSDNTNHNQIRQIITAQSGQFVNHANATQQGWQLQNVQQMTIRPDGTSELKHLPQFFTQLPIEPSSIYLLTLRPDDMSLTNLAEHRQLLGKDGRRSLPHEVAFWRKTLSPLAVLSLVLIACSFVFGSMRSQSLGFRIVVALLIGLLFSYIQDLVGFISLSTGFSPFIMVMLPIIISALLGIYLIKTKN